MTRLLVDLAELAAAASIGARAGFRREGRLAWGVTASGPLALGGCDLLAAHHVAVGGLQLSSTAAVVAARLAAHLLLIAGITLLVRARTAAQARASLLDAAVVAVTAAALAWTFLFAPYVAKHDPPLANELALVGYPVLALAAFVCAAKLASLALLRVPSVLLLWAGAAALLAADGAKSLLLVYGTANAELVRAGFAAFAVCLAGAALHPSAPELVAAAPDRQFRLTPVRVAGLAAGACALPAVLAVEGALDRVRDVTLLASCSGLVFVLVCLRLLDLGRRHEEALNRVTVLAGAVAGLLDVRTVADVADVARVAVLQLLGSPTAVTIEAEDVARPGSLSLPLHGRRGTHGALTVAGGEEVDPDRIEGIRQLAGSVALALDGVKVSEQLLRQRAEARFRALVQHSSDAILVVDAAGQIDYASPSTSRVLGQSPDELRGATFLELVADYDRPRVSHALAAGGEDAIQTLEFALTTPGGRLEVEATCTNLLSTDEVRGIVVNLRDVGERKDFERQLAHKAFHDELTGLANRMLFRDRVEHALARVSRGSSIAVLFLDLDDFKTVNDTLGHQAGDELIRIVAGRIAGSARSADTAARLGGDEFAVLLEDDDGNAEAIAHRLLEGIGAPITVEGHEFAMTASIGIARADAFNAIHVDDLMRNADVAMYAAKAGGKGTCRGFASEMHTAVLDRLELKRELQTAIERQEFELHYQPVVNLETMEIVSLEALIRWNHPTRGFVPPDQFIAIAEETGAIVSIGRWALRTACAQAAKIQRLVGPRSPTIAVNISGRQLQEPGLVDDTLKVLMQTGLAPEKLVLEITETVMISDFDFALSRLRELRNCKIRVALDDFGSGYSSLNYIRRLPIDLLKIDREFIADINESAEVAAMAETIIDLTRILHVDPVAEGIETEEQLATLRRLGCTLGQGYLFMRPRNAAEIEAEVVKRTIDRHPAVMA